MPVSPTWRLHIADEWLTNEVTALSIAVVDDSYTYDPADEFIDDVSASIVIPPIVLPSPALAIVSGQVWLTVDDDPPIEIPGIPAATDVAGLWVFDDTGNDATSRLVSFLDTLADSTPLGFEANGGSYMLTFPNGFVTRL